MRNKILLLIVTVVTIGMTACSKQMDDVLPGTWNISEWKYTDGTSTEILSDYGKMTFNENGTGVVVITYSGNSGTNDFAWTSSGKESVTINGDKYDVITNKPKKVVLQQSFLEESITITLEK